MRAATFLLGLVPYGLATSHEPGLQPDHESARKNAHHIFNAIHSAGRQWGSSLNHNGFSFFPAIVPRGTLLYHGTHYDHPPSRFEWLAFEMEHSENFAASFRIGQRPRHPRENTQQTDQPQVPLGSPGDLKPGDVIRGYLHTYQANRDLRLLYIDGTSAGKTNMGTLDSQDLVLLQNKTSDNNRFLGEMARASGLCRLAKEWGYDGVVRMEVGFEIIYCDFSNGINMTSATRTFLEEDKLHDDSRRVFHWARAASQRYDGLQGNRVRLDFSSMSSGFFFPINISSTDPLRPDLIRFAAASHDDLKAVKAHVERVATRPRKFTVDWQAVVDMAVSRFSDGLALMGWDACSPDNFLKELDRTTLAFFDAPPRPDDVNMEANGAANATLEAVNKCTTHYLMPALLERDDWSPEDELIHTALETVLGETCQRLFAMRSMLLEATPRNTTNQHHIQWDAGNHKLQEALRASRGMTRELMGRLAWTDWKKQRPCRPDEMMFVAMWPFGDVNDHEEPGCRTMEQLNVPPLGYWKWAMREAESDRVASVLDALGPRPDRSTDAE